MKKLYIIFFLIINISASFSQSLYIRTFGKPTSKAMIFLHGGPGYNCASFERTTAQRLADSGYFVIVYDRRGEGRSTDKLAKFSFEETFQDINEIYKKYNLKKAILIGHSFGGVVATKYALNYFEQVESIIYVGAPMNLQESFQTIQNTCKRKFEAANDSFNLKQLNKLKTMDSTSIMFSSMCFMYAMQNGFYSTKNPSDEAKKYYSLFKTDSVLKKYAGNMSVDAPTGFHKNNQYTTLDLNHDLITLRQINIPLYGLYGKEDGLYSAEQIEYLTIILGTMQMKYLDNCSHSVFIDQQSEFISAIKNWIH